MKISVGIALVSLSLGLAPSAFADDPPAPPQEPVGTQPAPKKKKEPKKPPRPPVGKVAPGTRVEEPPPKPDDTVGTEVKPDRKPDHKVGKVMRREEEPKGTIEPEGKRGPQGGEGTRTATDPTPKKGKKAPPPSYGDPPKE